MNDRNPERLRPARRFLHVCYCTADSGPATKFFVELFGMKNTMTAEVRRSSGAVLGLDGETTSGAAFVYDARGPRVSPALEIQTWIDPPLVGEPPTDPTVAGIHALGIAVPDLAAAEAAVVGAGCTVIGRGALPGIGDMVTVRDPRGVTLDLVGGEPRVAGSPPSRLRHLRSSVTDLEASLPWFDDLGFDLVDRATLTDGAPIGVEGPVDAEMVRLRLPDEPFELVLIQWRTPRTKGRHTDRPNHAGLFRAALGVDDTVVAYESLLADGTSFDRAPMVVPLVGTPVPDLVICFLSDPDGVPFEFVQRPRSAFR